MEVTPDFDDVINWLNALKKLVEDEKNLSVLVPDEIEICKRYGLSDIQIYSGIEIIADVIGAELDVREYSEDSGGYEKSFMFNGIKVFQYFWDEEGEKNNENAD